VIEAGWNWGVMYDWLDTIENVAGVELAHPIGCARLHQRQ
jgi:hypothetical protein